jgi:hypothetical protein
MNFFSIIICGYIIVAVILIFILYRDQQNKKLFFGKNKTLAWVLIFVLFLGIVLAIRTKFVEPFYLTINNEQLTTNKLTQPVKIAFITDIQVGQHKQIAWVEKIVDRLEKIKPDLIILGGDLINNEGTAIDESKYLEPLKKLTTIYPTYYIMGNHEYGIGSAVRTKSAYWTGDKSQEVMARMKKINVQLLKDQIACPKINNQTICLYGIDDIWHEKPTFTQLPTTTISSTLILISHNPDGILYWPTDKQKPDIVLSGHTHGGQIRLPLIGPLAHPGVELGTKYYQGLNYFRGIPIFASVGAGESGGAMRLFVPPEIAVIELRP